MVLMSGYFRFRLFRLQVVRKRLNRPLTLAEKVLPPTCLVVRSQLLSYLYALDERSISDVYKPLPD
jgi:hypothetical protein